VAWKLPIALFVFILIDFLFSPWFKEKIRICFMVSRAFIVRILLWARDFWVARIRSEINSHLLVIIVSFCVKVIHIDITVRLVRVTIDHRCEHMQVIVAVFGWVFKWILLREFHFLFFNFTVLNLIYYLFDF
jgi:hypothetical protein